MTLERFFVGVDVGSKELVFVVLNELEEEVEHGSFSNGASGFKRFKRFLLEKTQRSSEAVFHIGMESTGVYHDKFVNFLYKSHDSLVPYVFNPNQVKKFGESYGVGDKTDLTDARNLAKFLAYRVKRDEARRWEPPSEEFQILRDLVNHRDHLLETKGRVSQRLHAKEKQSGANPFILDSLKREITTLKNEISQTEKNIRDHIKNHQNLKEDVNLITSVKGVGATTAATWLAYLGDIRRFDDPRELVAYLGLVPVQKQSGTSIHGKPHISHKGLRQLRKALYMPIMGAATNHDTYFKEIYERLVKKGKASKVALIACMRKLVHILYGILRTRTPFDLAVAQGARSQA
jgi:transposase